ncbi:MAG: hypothetical protein VYA53_09345 [Acidobacteriota bacterium]|nr:hypothetical protein [Acidobacteriota bacterium]
MTDRNKAILLAVFIFASGVVLGGGLTFFMSGPRFPVQLQISTQRPQVESLNRLLNQLDLEASHQEELQQILRDSQEGLNDNNREFNQRNRTIRNNTHEKIRQVLSPEQMEQFEEFLRIERQKMFRRRGPGQDRGRRGPRPMQGNR